VRLTDTGGGIGDKVVWRVNGVSQGAVQTKDAQTTAGDGYRDVSQTLQVDPSRRNVIEITAYNGKGLLATLPYHLEIDKFGATTTERPRMFIVAVGVSNYVRADWSLQYAALDAKAISDRLRDVARPLYGEPKVVLVLEGDATAKGIEAAINNLAGEVKPSDVFVLYIAGHGHSIAGTYYFLPQDLTFDNGRTIENAAISQDMLQAWVAKIPARKSLLILDSDESASAIRGNVEQDTAIDRLQHAIGRSVITAASDAAHEGYEGHGLLTGAILDALTKSAGGGDNEVTVMQVANYAYQHVPEISEQVWGERQQPHIKIVDDFPLGVRAAAPAQTDTEEIIPNTPTHVLIRAERVREQPTDNSSGAVTLSSGAQVRVVKLVGAYSIISRDGVKLGYVPSEALSILH
jgi:caspase domain-containing protein